MLLFPAYYRQFGIVRPQQLANPRIFPFAELQLPRDAVLHYIDDTHMTLGPSIQDLYFTGLKKRIPIYYCTKLDQVSIGGRGLNKPPQPLIREHLSKEPQFKPVPHATWEVQDPTTPLVCSYALLPGLYQYQKKPLALYTQWRDIYTTWWSVVQELAAASDRQQFIPITIPSGFPSQSVFKQFETQRTQAFLSAFPTPAAWFLHELWCWLSPDPKRLTVLAPVDAAVYAKLNFILVLNGQWTVLNIGYLTQWVEGLHAATDKAASQFTRTQMQKLLLKLCLSLKAPAAAPVAPVRALTRDVPSVPVADRVARISGDATEEPTVLDTDDDASMADIFEEADEDLEAADFLANAPIHRHRALARMSIVGEPTVSAVAPDATVLDVPSEDPAAVRALILYDPTPEEVLQETVYAAAEQEQLTAAEYKTLLKDLERAAHLPAPDDPGQILGAYAVIPHDALALTKTPLPGTAHLPDASMQYSSLQEFDRRYITDILPKDIAGAVHAMQRTGVILQNYQVERETSILGAVDMHTLTVRPVGGASSTIRFKLPVIQANGEYMVNGKKQRQRKQRRDLPIRKVGPATVTLTSYYAKLFVRRSEKKVNDSYAWIANEIRTKGLLGTDPWVLNITPANVFNNQAIVPRVYSAMAQHFRAITLPDLKLEFDYSQRPGLFGPEQLAAVERNGRILVGRTKQNAPVVVDAKNQFYAIAPTGEILLGTLIDLTHLDQSKVPLDYTILRVFRRDIPLAVIFGYFLGLNRLLALLEVVPRRVPARMHVALTSDEWGLRFKDQTLVFKRSQLGASLLLAGFKEIRTTLAQYPAAQFDTSEIYFNALEAKEPCARHLRELDMMQAAFVDPITRDVLIDLKEPTTFLGLLERANQLLITDGHPDTYSLSAQRIAGYERISGAVYGELMRSIRDYRGRANRRRAKIEMSPYAVWTAVTQDPANTLVADINPIENIKQTEMVTYGGTGGRGSESMTKELRVYNKDDMGVISESTTDSKDVGVNVYTCANPLFTSLRGMTERFDPKVHGPANLLSTPALTAVGAAQDDPKRVNFISIQHSHSIASAGYHQPLIRTGYEEVLAHRTTALFAYLAPQAGTVISRAATGIVIELENKERVGIALGRIYGQAEGTTYPNDVISTWNAGDTFPAGAPIAYNTGFFEPDVLDPQRIIWKTAMLVKTALYETPQTHEDSGAISAATAKKLTTKKLEVRTFVVDFKQGIQQVALPGTVVKPTDVLLFIEDELTATYTLFDEKNLDTLRLLSNKAPKAKCFGTIDRVEVYYHGSKADMSESLLKLVKLSDKRLADLAAAIGEPKVTGAVNSEYRVEGKPLELDTAEIRVSILIEAGMGVGDKGVFAHQMKSVIGEVMDYPMTTEQGETIDAVFGYRSIANRVVLSPELIGTTNTLLCLIQSKAVALYNQD